MLKHNHLSPRAFALTVGITILFMAAGGGFSYGFVLNSILIPNDATATFAKLQSAPMLFRAGILSFLGVIMCDILCAWGLYHLLRGANEALAQLAAWFRVAFAAAFAALLSFLVSVLPLSQNASHAVQIHQLLTTFNNAWSLALVLFGIHLLLVGYIVATSGEVPKILGFLAMFAALCYIGTSVAALVIPQYALYKPSVEAVLSLPMALGELSLGLWYLLKGGKAKK
ncbi:MAG: DUF4386 domain-containing protein [Candidatus Kapaibacterium sp.]|nr:MAG: DUF4386 domain-containing protein [Candidatus Kapabacteria bacterium]